MKINNTQNLFRKQELLGFTLVELIVVITILVILGTIAFISLSGYSSSARDSSRVSDIANLSQGIDISYIKTGSYPTPDRSFVVTYSGGTIWTQGVIGDTLINLLSSVGANMSKKPVDPLNAKEYTYSVLTHNNKAYQLKADWEGDRIAYIRDFSFINQASAASSNPSISYIKGNYNRLAVKTLTGGMIYILAVPSIITSATGAVVDIMSLSGKILFHGQTNSGGITFAPTLIYSSGALPRDDTASGITNLVIGLQSAYSGSVIAHESNIKNLFSTTDALNIFSFGASIIMNDFGGKVCQYGDEWNGLTCVTPPFRIVYTSNGTLTIPANITVIKVKAWGGGGKNGTAGGTGGAGGFSQADIAVSEGQSYLVQVEGIGGLSGLFLGTRTQLNARIIAGAGGGGSNIAGSYPNINGTSGGNGGGANMSGSSGGDKLGGSDGRGGGGGTLLGGGVGGLGSSQGGFIGSSGSLLTAGNSGHGGSGGGGYYGGGSGGGSEGSAGEDGGGGGGSGYATGTNILSIMTPGDEDYAVGYGSSNQSGRVVITY